MNDPLTGHVRVKAVCLFTSIGRLLAIADFDPTKQRAFWVPVGGRVEFGETSTEAIVREVREELSMEITDLRFLGVLENIFEFDGDDGHEIVFVYDARFADSSAYDQPELNGMEGEKPFAAHWIDPSDPANGWPLYPEGLLGLLNSEHP
jgi:ADP-ribose pyrophosphatase YjhB (NUDIX family)